MQVVKVQDARGLVQVDRENDSAQSGGSRSDRKVVREVFLSRKTEKITQLNQEVLGATGKL